MAEGEAPVSFDEAVSAHDRAVAASGLVLWIGAEPTYTLRESTDPEWIGAALGSAKRTRAERVAAALFARSPGTVLLRSVGRQYPEEDRPRWSIGLYRRRDAAPCWSGPPDPLLGGRPSSLEACDEFAAALAARLARRGCEVDIVRVDDALPVRILAGAPGPLDRALVQHPETHAPSVHARATPPSGLVDPLAAQGAALVRIGRDPETPAPEAWGVVRVELPALGTVADFQTWLADVGAAASAAGLEGLVLGGYPPPVDASVAWTTVTPDPGVVEINMAPGRDLRALLTDLRAIDAAAREAGLSPERFYYNGEETDSGGAGHVTLGGVSPAASPFLERFRILPRLVRYVVRHPSLSYLFVGERVGSGSQSPRVDEVVRESLGELRLALARLERAEQVDAPTLWASLAPFLTDRMGNTHRAEINVEKLWNGYLPGRGELGLVELRAVRMGTTPEHLAAHAAVLRAVVAMLAERDVVPALVDWGHELHDRFALPYHLERDLDEVLRDLAACGLGLAAPIVERARDDAHRRIAELDLDGVSLVVRQALEFRPLVGDLSAQHGSSRLVDSSTQRVEIWVRARDTGAWSAVVDGRAVELPACDEGRVLGLRFRAFVPYVGLHPGLPPRDPFVVDLLDHGRNRTWRLTLHHWRPDGEAYAGLPLDATDARARRSERLTVVELGSIRGRAVEPAPPEAVSPWAFDTRALP